MVEVLYVLSEVVHARHRVHALADFPHDAGVLPIEVPMCSGKCVVSLIGLHPLSIELGAILIRNGWPRGDRDQAWITGHGHRGGGKGARPSLRSQAEGRRAGDFP